jgi:phosphoribosylaminoimidazolecarboxamide formyltransferase/IMP cyclohydrolase
MRALISVSDKIGVVNFAGALAKEGVEIISTGGTATALKAAGINVVEVSEFTGFPEMMDGRLKTLHHKVMGGILGRPVIDSETMQEHGILPIDLVVVNFYPFEKVVADPLCRFEKAIENIDIGGPSMVRAAGKNWKNVAVVVDPNDYTKIVMSIIKNGNLTDGIRLDLLVKAFRHTARYEAAISEYLVRYINGRVDGG